MPQANEVWDRQYNGARSKASAPSAVVRGGYGLVGDIIVGVAGAFLGGFIFRGLHIGVPFGGLPGTIFVAFIGAVILLLMLRLVNRGWRRRSA